MNKVPFTKKGYDQLKQQLKILKTVDMPQATEDLHIARSFGDLSENAEYKAAREKQGLINKKIISIQDKLRRAQIIDPTKFVGKDTIMFGAYVSLKENNTSEIFTYQIVGEDEADIKEKKISVTSLVARQIIGKKLNDVVKINKPNELLEYHILNIEYR